MELKDLTVGTRVRTTRDNADASGVTKGSIGTVVDAEYPTKIKFDEPVGPSKVHDRWVNEKNLEPVVDDSTAKRFNTGKPRIAMNLVGREVSECEAKVWEMGAEKYGVGNWQKGQQLSTCMDSVLRHATAIMNGEFIDPESGLPHVGHLITASKIAAHSYLTKPELNDIEEKDSNGKD